MSTDDQHLLHTRHVEAYEEAMAVGVDALARHIGSTTRPATGRSPEEAAARVGGVDLDRPLGGVDAALSELDRLWLDDAVWFHEPGYAAHLNCPVMVPAVLGDALAAAVNPSLDTFDQSVGATMIERELVAWAAGRVGWRAPQHQPDGVFTSGGTHSNLQGLMLARDEARERGAALADLRFLCSEDAHFSVHTGARLLGLSSGAVVPVAVDERHRMRPQALSEAVEACRRAGTVPAAIVATAGTTDFGAIDPLPEIADIASSKGLWLHVDAAYGGGLLASRRHRERLAGIERADSVTVDFHKTWFQPVACSAVLVRDAAHLRHVAWHADYLNPADCPNPNQVDKSLQTTRRFDALKLWLTLRTVGADTIGEHVDALLELTRAVHAALVDEYVDIELAAAPELSTLVFRWLPAVPGLPEEQVDGLNRQIRQALYASGEAMVAATSVAGRQHLKLTLLNPLATVEDVLDVIDLLCAAGRRLAADHRGTGRLAEVPR